MLTAPSSPGPAGPLAEPWSGAGEGVKGGGLMACQAGVAQVCTDLSWRGLCPDRVYTTSEQGTSPARGALTYHTLCCLAAQAGFLSKISVEMQKPQNLAGVLCLRSLGSSLGQALPVLRDRNESDSPRKSNVA